MSDKRSVIIDGVKYVPAADTVANATEIKQGLIKQFWGITTPDNIDEHWRDLKVIVTDSELRYGESIDDVLESIAFYANKKEGER